MKQYIEIDEWKIRESKFDPALNKISESLCSIGNARLGQRANFEEGYSGDSLKGSYIAGIYYPDKTKVGWWKNGYPEFFAKVLNSCNWIGVNIILNDQKVDLANATITSFQRTLEMKEGILSREVQLSLADGTALKLSTERFYSYKRKNIGAIKLQVEIIKGSGQLKICPYLDFDVVNEDSNYDEQFWTNFSSDTDAKGIYVFAETKKTLFAVGAYSDSTLTKNQTPLSNKSRCNSTKKTCQLYTSEFKTGDQFELYKYAGIVSSFYEEVEDIRPVAQKQVQESIDLGYEALRQEQVNAWEKNWETSDIKITGDPKAQQGIRFNIFHLNQTYDGNDSRLNIGPKGFTGEKYGGSTYWDTEAYCLPFYMYTSDKKVPENLLKYRFDHLEKAIKNAEKLGFNNGAALYPMVTIDGDECHNEWEITFEEIHRNNAIAYAIKDFTSHFTDYSYLDKQGIFVLIAICKFWAQRVNFSKVRNQYMILGVTGPNEYENNVNNNWYTNYSTKWCLRYTCSQLDRIKSNDVNQYDQIIKKTSLTDTEIENWKTIADQIALPYDEKLNIYLQQDGFLDKDLKPISQLEESNLPINQNWSWDRILRSAYIKQADVLQGFYFFEDDFTEPEHQKHFEFYEPLTVHESSLSPCVHVILASKLGLKEKAYEMYLQTSRLDIDDYNNDTEDGLHITSMAGTWMSIVKGFAGIRMNDGQLSIKPSLPKHWECLKFNMKYKGETLNIKIEKTLISIQSEVSIDIPVIINGDLQTINTQTNHIINL